MKRFVISVLAFGVVCSSLIAAETAAEEPVMQPMFTGSDLSGWTTTGNWSVDADGVVALTPREGEKGWERYDAYLTTEAEYGNFIAELEVKFEKKGNSGFYFHIADPADPVTTGIEVQIIDTHHKTKLSHHDCGGVIKTQAPSKNMVKPAGEWNHFRITCINKQLQVELNGEQVIDVNLDDSPMNDRPARGRISLQDHGLPIWFRNVQIQALD